MKYKIKICIRILKIIEEGVINFAGEKDKEKLFRKSFSIR